LILYLVFAGAETASRERNGELSEIRTAVPHQRLREAQVQIGVDAGIGDAALAGIRHSIGIESDGVEGTCRENLLAAKGERLRKRAEDVRTELRLTTHEPVNRRSFAASGRKRGRDYRIED
jgi:hypothetical protein